MPHRRPPGSYRDRPAEVADGYRSHPRRRRCARGAVRPVAADPARCCISWSNVDGCTAGARPPLEHGRNCPGCDRRAPWHRLDRSGLVLLIGGHEIVELSSDVATIRTRTGSVLRHRRRPPAKPPVALLWEVLTSRAHPTGSAPVEATGPPIRQSERGSGWRRRSRQDPAAILTTITR